MAKSCKAEGYGYDAVVLSFQEFITLSGGKNKNEMTSKAFGKMVDDCLGKDFKKYDIKTIGDASTFPVAKEKGKPFMLANKTSAKICVRKMALEVAKKKTKNSKLEPKDPEVKATKQLMKEKLAKGKPQVKSTKMSSTGGVAKMTDTSQYTGSHAERFGKDGKGKGIEGREDRQDASGYTHNYKGQGTFDKK